MRTPQTWLSRRIVRDGSKAKLVEVDPKEVGLREVNPGEVGVDAVDRGGWARFTTH